MVVCDFAFSEQLCASELHGRRTSISSGEKIVSELQSHAAAYSRDRSRAESEPDPDRDIELELRALDLEDSDHQEIKSQVVNDTWVTHSEKIWRCLNDIVILSLSQITVKLDKENS